MRRRPMCRAECGAVAAIGISAVVMLIAVGRPVTTTAMSPGAKRLLFLTHNAFHKHDSLGPAERAVVELGVQGGFEVTALKGYKQDADEIDLSFISAAYLAQFDAIMMMTNGELPMTAEQKRALIEFVRNGKGFVAVHQTVVTFYTFAPFGELLGAYFAAGPIFDVTNSAKRVAVLKVEDREHPATRMLGDSWSLHDEMYQFAREIWDPAQSEENIGPTGHPVPVAFSRDRVHGRSFYTSLGHRACGAAIHYFGRISLAPSDGRWVWRTSVPSTQYPDIRPALHACACFGRYRV